MRGSVQLTLVVVVTTVAGYACEMGQQRTDSDPPAGDASMTEAEQTLTVNASAYNSIPGQTVGDPNEGAWGDRITPGMQVIAVSPDLIDAGLAYQTEVQIEGLPGTWTVLDRTASRHRNRIDIYMGTDLDAAVEWGIQEVIITWSDE